MFDDHSLPMTIKLSVDVENTEMGAEEEHSDHPIGGGSLWDGHMGHMGIKRTLNRITDGRCLRNICFSTAQCISQ